MDDLHGGHKRDICRMRRLGTLMVLGWDGDAFWDVPEAPVSIPLRSLPGSSMMLTDVVWTDLCVRRWDLGTTQLTGSVRPGEELCASASGVCGLGLGGRGGRRRGGRYDSVGLLKE